MLFFRHTACHRIRVRLFPPAPERASINFLLSIANTKAPPKPQTPLNKMTSSCAECQIPIRNVPLIHSGGYPPLNMQVAQQYYRYKRRSSYLSTRFEGGHRAQHRLLLCKAACWRIHSLPLLCVVIWRPSSHIRYHSSVWLCGPGCPHRLIL